MNQIIRGLISSIHNPHPMHAKIFLMTDLSGQVWEYRFTVTPISALCYRIAFLQGFRASVIFVNEKIMIDMWAPSNEDHHKLFVLFNQAFHMFRGGNIVFPMFIFSYENVKKIRSSDDFDYSAARDRWQETNNHVTISLPKRLDNAKNRHRPAFVIQLNCDFNNKLYPNSCDNSDLPDAMLIYARHDGGLPSRNVKEISYTMKAHVIIDLSKKGDVIHEFLIQTSVTYKARAKQTKVITLVKTTVDTKNPTEQSAWISVFTPMIQFVREWIYDKSCLGVTTSGSQERHILKQGTINFATEKDLNYYNWFSRDCILGIE